MTIAALVERRTEAERGENAPGAGDGGITRVIALDGVDAVERVAGDIEELGVVVVLREAQNQLGERRRSCEAIEIEADAGSRPLQVERGQGIEVPSGL